MLGRWFGSEKISKRFARKVRKYCYNCKVSMAVNERKFIKLVKQLKRHMRRCLPKDNFYLQLDPCSMFDLRVTSFPDADELDKETITITDVVMNASDTDADYDEHEGTIFVPIKDSTKFVAVDYVYEVRRN